MSEICRLCLAEDTELTPIFSTVEMDAVSLDDLIAMCTTLVITRGDQHSTKICGKCYQFLNDWFKFRQSCLEADAQLQTVADGFQCKQCPDRFEGYRELKQHCRRVHVVRVKRVKEDISAAAKPFACSECGKTDFVSAETLRRHKLLHTGRFGCNTCGKTFTCHAILRIHQRDKHENDRPFVCDVCGKAFVTELLMKYHQRFHTGEKKYVCDVCGIAVTTSSSLSKHKKRHAEDKPHVCDYCGKGFIVRARLVEHIRMHTGERPFACDVCGKAFTMNDKLTRHKKTHSGARPFFCDVCGNAYSTNHGLTVHRKTHSDG